MPPAHPAHDPLDVALGKTHPAANPRLTKPQAGFFGAVAGERSPINRQSSRIASPFATHQLLGGQGASVVDEPTQLALAASTLGQTPRQRLAKTIADDATPGHGRSLPMTPAASKVVATAPKTGGRAARARAKKTEAAYAGPAGHTLKLPVHTDATVGPYAGLGSGTSVPIAASGPSLLAAATRARSLGIPIASLSSGLQDKISEALTAATLDPTYKFNVPDLRYYTAKDKASFGLPPTATDGDVIRKRFADYSGQPSYLSGLISNVPRSALQFASAPVILANALGAVGHEGIVGDLNSDPTHLFGAFQGNWTPAKQLGLEALRQQKAFGGELIHDPLGTLQRDPVGVATIGLAGARLAGAGAGIAARTGALGKGLEGAATPTLREVRPAGFDKGGVKTEDVPKIPRGMTSKKLDERAAQAASDWLASHSDFFGGRLEGHRSRNVKREESRMEDQRYRENVEPAVKAVAALKRPVRRAVLFARGQGTTEEALAQHFETLASEHRALEHAATNENETAHWRLIQHDLEKSAKDWRGVADQVAGVMTPEMQVALHHAVRASRAGEAYMKGQQRLGGQPILTDFTANRRAYHTLAKIQAKAGDANSQEWLDLDAEAQALEKKLAKAQANPSRYEAIQKRLETVRNEQYDAKTAAIKSVDQRRARVQRIADLQDAAGKRTPAFNAVEKVINLQGKLPRPEAARLAEMQGRAGEAFPAGDRIRPSELEAADKHLRLLERKLRAAQGPATRRRLQAKIDEFTPIRDQMAAAPVGPEVRQLRAQAARAGVEQRAFGAAEQAAAPRLPKALRADERTHASLTRPVDRELARLTAERDRAIATRRLPSDYHTLVTRQLERRAQMFDPERIASELQIAEDRAAQAFARLRNAHRAETRGPGHAVEPNAPLDESDPLYFPHTRSNSGLLKRRIVGGQGGGKVNLDVVPNYGKRLGEKGSPFSGHVLETGGVETDPAAFFGAAAKPARIASALEHLRNQMTEFSVKTYEGMGYDARRWVRLDLGKKGGESPLTAGARTSDPLDRKIDETGKSKSLLHELLGKFQDEADRTERHQATALHKTIPADGQEYVLVSRQAYNALQNDFLHGGIYDNALLAKLQRGTQMWRWATLMARPAWLVSNIAGNTIQAATGGAGPLSFARALRQDYKDVTPDRAQNTGLFRNDVMRPASAGPAHTVLGKFGDFVTNANVAFENYARRALYLRHAIPEAKRAARAAENKRISSGFLKVNDDLKPHLEALARGEQAEPQITKIVNRWLGDFSRSKNTPIVDLISPFHRWFEFITKLVTTMPVRTPGRALVLQRLGELGIQQQNQQFGDFTPNNLVGSVGVGGLFKSTQALNPYATVFQLLDPEDQSTHNPGHPGFGGLAQALNPAVTALFEGATGYSPALGMSALKDSKGNPVGPMNPRVLLHDLETIIPLSTAVQGYDVAPTSINPFDPQEKTKGAFAQQPIPAWMRAAGYFGGSIRPYDARKNEATSIKRLISGEKTRARNTAKAQR